MFADAGAKPPPGLGTGDPEQVGAAVVRAIEREQGRDRRGAAAAARARPLRPRQPGDRGQAQSGSAGQKAAKAIADGHAA